MKLPKSIVLLSGGLDSTVNFCKALNETKVVLALTFNYGQRAASNECSRARKICKKYGVIHRVIDLEWLKGVSQQGALVNLKKRLPKLSSSQLDDRETALKTAKKVWVPNRNGVFIHIAASFAEGLEADQVVVGFNAEEAITFPDNSLDFLNRVNSSLELSTLSRPKVVCYTTDCRKVDIVKLGKTLDAPFDLMWSCYESGKRMCRACESCQRFFRAIEKTKTAHERH